MENVKLKKRLKRKNTKDRKVFYWPLAISHNRNLEPGTPVICLEDATGTKPRLVKVARVEDLASARFMHGTTTSNVETFHVFLEDLTE